MNLLADEDVSKIIEAAYHLLINLGVRTENREALELYAQGGAEVDFSAQVAKLNPALIDRALKTVPGSFSVWSQDLEYEAVLAGDELHFAAGSLPVNILDSETEVIRAPTIPDLKAMNHLIETLEYVDFQTGPILPPAIPDKIQDVFRFLINMSHSNKPYFGGALSVDGMRCQIEMLKIMRGSSAELKAKPRVIFAANPTAPLSWGPIIAQNLIDSARAWIPVMLIPMPLPGGTAPVTLAGVLAEHTAENLGGIVLAQLANPGAPVLYGGGAILLDMRTGLSCIGAIESQMLGSGYARIGKALGLPTASNIGQSDSQRVDSQAGLESGIGIAIAALSGINLSRGAGMLFYANCQSMEKLVIDNNICGMARRLAKGIQVGPDQIAQEMIVELGHGASGYINSTHTLKNFRQELFFPTEVIHRKGAVPGEMTPTAFERAKQEVKDRLAKYQPNPMPKEMVAELTKMTESFAREKGISALPKF